MLFYKYKNIKLLCQQVLIKLTMIDVSYKLKRRNKVFKILYNIMSSNAKTVEKRGDAKNNRARLVFVAISIFIQIFWILYIFMRLGEHYAWILGLVRVLGILVVIGIYNSDKVANIKLPWIILILLAPIMGLVFYIMVKYSGTTKNMKRRLQQALEKSQKYIVKDEEVAKKLKEKDRDIYNLSEYVYQYSKYPLYSNTDIEYFADTKDAISRQIECMKNAKKFIFMSYFAIEDAKIFFEIKKVLSQKVKEGVEVRIFYDDIGSVGFIDNAKFIKELKELGIDCRVFNPVTPILNLFFNNRDHRKISVIDGNFAFTGGYNIADEYFNILSPYGHWKDSGIMLRGDIVKELTVTFLETWNANRKSKLEDINDDKYFEKEEYIAKEEIYALAYGDSPLDGEELAENVYINLINMASDYVYIMSPYLIITDDMKSALVRAAKRGIDVRLITPGIPDKKIIYGITRSFYGVLAKAGVKIYEYTPGFCHAKQMLTDDRLAICGTINLDYRSLYLHFENAVMFTKCKAIFDMKEDFYATIELSNEVSLKYANLSRPRSIFDSILRLFAPLL